ncbi:MAG: ribonuclease R family protein, partial [bacterium]
MRDSTNKGFRIADESGIPVPSRLQLLEMLSELGQPVTFNTLCRRFEIKQKEAKQALFSRLDRLQHQGVVIIDRKGRYALPDKMGAFIGRVIGHSNGYGFVRPDQGGDDLYLHHRQMRKVLHGDRVVAKLKNIDSRGRREGVIVEVIVDPDREIVGHFHLEGGVGFVEPDDGRFGRDIAIPDEHFGAAQSGDIVVVKIIKHPVQHHHAVGRISHIMGSELAPGMETEIAIRKHEIPNVWPDEVERQLTRHDKKFRIAKLEKGREDIRHLPLVTIDGEDAKDFDDAVYCSPNRRGWRLVVAIADVSHYVKVNSALDDEAFNRGNSVYFPNRVVPMLPEMLSNGICSLNPAEDRCCMVCDMQISRAGKILDYSFFPGLMHSRARLTYTTVARIVVNKDIGLCKQYSDVVDELESLRKLYTALSKQRDKRGTVNFEFPEPFIHFDDQQRIDRVSVRE